jgi:hypothetical protein
MTDLYPEMEPYAHGWLDVGDGNLVYWETYSRRLRPVQHPHPKHPDG